MPKLYFYDTGLACTLLGLETSEQLETHYLKGALYENLIILELLKGRLNKGLLPNLYFWRDRSGHEIDLIAEWGGKIKAIEIKAGSTFQSKFNKNLQYFCKLSSDADIEGYLVYNGEQEGKFLDISLIPAKKINQLL